MRPTSHDPDSCSKADTFREVLKITDDHNRTAYDLRAVNVLDRKHAVGRVIPAGAASSHRLAGIADAKEEEIGAVLDWPLPTSSCVLPTLSLSATHEDPL